jgi:hypothetical protein
MNARILKKLSKRAEPYIKHIISNPVNNKFYLDALELRECSPESPTFDITNYADKTIFFCEWVDVQFLGHADSVWVECPAYELLLSMIMMDCGCNHVPFKSVSDIFEYAGSMS